MLAFDVHLTACQCRHSPNPTPTMQPRLLGSGTPPRSLCAFLSFATKDAALVEVFRNRIGKQYPGVELLDHAVKDGYEEDWQEECARKIDRAEWLI